MLVLSRKLNERIVIGGSVVLTVVRVDGNSVRIGFEAPPDVTILRSELLHNVEPRDGAVPQAAWSAPA